MSSEPPFPTNGAGDGPAGSKACPRCGRLNPAAADNCERCRVFLRGNQAATTHGLYRQQQPLDLRMSSDEFRAGIVDDLGGVAELSTLERGTANNLAILHSALTLLVNDLITHGLFTPSGNPRRSYDRFLQGLDRWVRLGDRIGYKRRAKVVSLAELLNQSWPDESSADDAPSAEQAAGENAPAADAASDHANAPAPAPDGEAR
jgi:hypothetical protein